MSGRLSQGGLIDRSREMVFLFDGRPFRGFGGDTLASALVANGVKLVGRSFKYHRPRGILTAGGEEPNALVELRTGDRCEPNTRATTTELFDGLRASSQNRWPSLGLDLMAVNGLAAPLFAAGFYYKTFMWPAAFWEKVYEPTIRKAAGLGRASVLADPDRYDRMHAFCDLLVIGGGAAGLAAALTAGRAGARVILCDDDFLPGGRLLSERQEIDGIQSQDWARAAHRELASLPNVRVLTRTSVFGAFDDGVFGAVERLADHLPTPGQGARQRYWKIAARRSILAAGAIERPLVFGGNDRPGVMNAGAVRTYLNRFAALPGKRAAVFTTGDDGWRTADDLIAAGVEVAAVIDARDEVDTRLGERVRAAGVEIILGGQVTATRGRGCLSGVEVRTSGANRKIAADVLAMSGGWDPAIGLAAHHGARPVWSGADGCFQATSAPRGMSPAGAAAGAMTLSRALADGALTAVAALDDLGIEAYAPAWRADDEPRAATPLWHVKASRGPAFVDFQHDVTAKDVALAAQEGFRSVELLKRYTTLGMATDQGKTSNVNGYALLAEATGKSLSTGGAILARPPHQPAAIGVLAGNHRGAHFRPARLAPSHDWAAAQGAVFVDAGAWKRAQWYPEDGEGDWLVSVSREVTIVRNAVGVCDVSTLGKIEVMGPDAAAFLDRVYINTFSTLPVGRARYGVMLREDGFVMDDGTAARLAPDRFVVSTTTLNAVKVMQHLEFCRQVLWPELDVQLASVTEQWAQYAIAGPRSRTLMQRLLPHATLDDAAFPYMAAGGARWRGVGVRIFRLSFSGELAYEIAAPAQYGQALIEDIAAVGSDLELAPYGTEALAVMRIEKGHVGGSELNGQTTAHDLGLGRMMSSKKDFVGRALAARPALTAMDRLQFTGFRPVEPGQRLRAGAHFLPLRATATASNGQGHMTSTAWSPTLNSWIGLGLLKAGSVRHGERLRAYDPVRGGDVEVEACSPAFVDPDGGRLHGRY